MYKIPMLEEGPFWTQKRFNPGTWIVDSLCPFFKPCSIQMPDYQIFWITGLQMKGTSAYPYIIISLLGYSLYVSCRTHLTSKCLILIGRLRVGKSTTLWFVMIVYGHRRPWQRPTFHKTTSVNNHKKQKSVPSRLSQHLNAARRQKLLSNCY